MNTDPRNLLHDGLAPMTVPAGLGVRAYGRWRRRRAWRRALFGGATAGLAVVIVVSISAAGDPFGVASPRPVASSHIYLPPGVVDSAKLVEYTRTVLPPGSGSGLGAPSQPGWGDNPRYTHPVVVQRNYRGLSVSSFYPRPGPKMFTESTRVTTPTRPVRQGGEIAQTNTVLTGVTFSNRTWWRYMSPNFPLGNGNDPWCTSDDISQNLEQQITGWARVVAALLACRYVQVGPCSRVDGQRAVELSHRAARADNGIWWHLWVNPATYLPIQLVIRWLGNPKAPPGVNETVTFHWLPPTKANLAPFNVTVPPGYKRVSPPVG